MEKLNRPFEVYKGKIRRQISLFDNEKVYINLLSVYDMLLCERMAKTFVVRLINEGFERRQAITVAENACLSTMCLTDKNTEPIYLDADQLMRKLTAEDVLMIVKEYNLLRKDYMGFDELNSIEFENEKKN